MSPVYALFVTNAGRAVAELTEAGLEPWNPTYAKVRHRHHKPELIRYPLVQGYVFVRLSPADFRAAVNCSAVAYVVSSGGVPRAIPEAIVQELHDLVQSGRHDEALPPVKDPPKPSRSHKRRWNKNRARGIRKRGLEALQVWFASEEAPALEAA